LIRKKGGFGRPFLLPPRIPRGDVVTDAVILRSEAVTDSVILRSVATKDLLRRLDEGRSFAALRMTREGGSG
jgi:hypothetical protein